MNVCVLKFLFLQCFESEIQRPLLRLQNIFLPATKSLKRNIVHDLCIRVFDENIYHFPTVFQSKDTDPSLEILYCGKWRKISKSHPDLDLDRTMPNVRAIFIYYNMFKFQVD